MKYYFLSISLFLCICKDLSAQSNDKDIRLGVVKTVIEGYNNQDYKTMRQPWATWAKLFVTTKKLQKEYSPLYEKYGKATIDTVTYSSKYEYVAKLKMEKDNRSALYFSFIFSDKGKIEGFGETYPPLIYSKSTGTTPINGIEFSNKVDSLLSQKYVTSTVKSFNGSLMVIDNGKPIYKKHCGYADLYLKTEINDSTLFDLASVSKQFTAIAILALEESGKLSLNDSIQKFIPDFPYHGISIKNLLTHTSGLPEYMGLMKKYWDKSKFASNNMVLEVMKKHQPKVLFQPNERFEYCNTGYLMLSMLIEKISGKSYSEYLNSTIFKPLGMSHTRVYNSRRTNGEKLNNCSNGYVYAHQRNNYILPDSTSEYQEVIYLDAITGDGNIYSCIQDLLIWENELLDPKILGTKIIQKAIANHPLKNGVKTNYGYGFFLTGGGNAEPLVFHTGGWPGYFCILMNFFDQKKQIVILSNNSYDNFTRIADDIVAMLIY